MAQREELGKNILISQKMSYVLGYEHNFLFWEDKRGQRTVLI